MLKKWTLPTALYQFCVCNVCTIINHPRAWHAKLVNLRDAKVKT